MKVGVRGRDIVVLGVEKKSVARLQDERTVRKICALDDNVCMAFAGLTADARIVINRARVECQSHRLTVEDPVTVEYITRYIASLKQRYTQSNGRRPFGISALIVGFDFDGTPRLYQTDPSGTYHAWKANAIGRGAKSVREFLEKNYTDEAIETDGLTIKLVIKALLEVVQSGGKNIELAVMRRDQPLKILNPEEIEKYVAEIEKEKEENEKKKQCRSRSGSESPRARSTLQPLPKPRSPHQCPRCCLASARPQRQGQRGCPEAQPEPDFTCRGACREPQATRWFAGASLVPRTACVR